MPTIPSFSTPAEIQDLSNQTEQQELNQLWNTNVNGFTQQAITGNPWNETNAANQNNYYNPLVTDVPQGTSAIPVTWVGFPNRMVQYLGAGQTPPNPYNLTQSQLWELADTGYYTNSSGQKQTFPDIPENLCPQPDWKGPLHPFGPYGPRGWQDEYCEWSVTRNSAGKITRVDFVCENPEYWYSLWRIDPIVAAQKYQEALNFGLPPNSPNMVSVKVEDLQLVDPSTGKPVIDPSTGNPAYNPLNKWNIGPLSIRGGTTSSGGAMHLTATPNTLQTELGLAGGASVLRNQGNSDPQALICCSQYGQPFRHSDPHIGQSVNQVVSAIGKASLANPVGLYLQGTSLASQNYQLPSDPNLPPGATGDDCWQIVRGSQTLTDPFTGQAYEGNFLLHLVFQIPAAWIQAGVKFTVGDIMINPTGQFLPIQWGAQLVDTLSIGLFARPLPPAITNKFDCVTFLDSTTTPPALPQPVQMMYAVLWNAYYATQVKNPMSQGMNLASNTVIVPPIVKQGASGIDLILTCSSVSLGPGGQYPQVGVVEGDIFFTTTSMTNVTYAAPGNSYPSEFQLLTLKVNVKANALLGLRNILLANYGQAPGQAAPAFLNVVPAVSASY